MSANTISLPATASSSLSLLWWRSALCYFVLAVGLGIAMGISEDHRLMGVHAHMNLLGWVSAALIGLLHHHTPGASQGRLGKIQFWVFQISLPLMMLGLAAKLLGKPGLDPLLGLGSLGVFVAVVLAACLFLPRLKPQD